MRRKAYANELMHARARVNSAYDYRKMKEAEEKKERDIKRLTLPATRRGRVNPRINSADDYDTYRNKKAKFGEGFQSGRERANFNQYVAKAIANGADSSKLMGSSSEAAAYASSIYNKMDEDETMYGIDKQKWFMIQYYASNGHVYSGKR